MNTEQYIELFIEESREQLQRLNQNLLALESNPNNTDGVNEIFRVAHTLKGMAGTMGFKSIANLTHVMENSLDAIKRGQVKPAPKVMDVLFECLDLLETYLQNIINTGTEGSGDAETLISKLDSLLNKQSLAKHEDEKAKQQHGGLSIDQYQVSVIEQGMKRGYIPYSVEVNLNKGCLLKSARAYVIFKAVEGLGDIIQSAPSVQDIENEKFESYFSLILISMTDRDAILHRLSNISEVDSVSVKQIKPEDLTRLVNDREAAGSLKANDRISRQDEQKASELSRRIGRNIRVDIERLDYLMNLVSELIIIKNRIHGMGMNSRTTDLVESIEYLGKVTTDLHDAVMKVRMVPVETVFNRFPRVVRDLAKETNKEVKLNIYGAGTELDRTIADEIGDPLVHLIRNAIDHGLESTDGRLSAGKNKVGNLDLIAYHDGNNVVIEVCDDGNGIDLNKVLKLAISMGMVDADEAGKLEEREIINFLFSPNISTADRISGISGRGVGMDAVKAKIESLGGVIEIETGKGKGTRFIIRLPLTLSIIKALIVKVQNEVYAIPLNSIKEILYIDASVIKSLRDQEVINYRELLIPLVRLDKRLNTAINNMKDDKLTTVVIVNKGDRLSALSVDELVGQQEIVIKTLGGYLSNIKVISGATILGDGQVILILDINHLI